jgi:hypothetical protein
MADKLDWLGKHLVLIRHLTVADAVSLEAYKIPPDLEDLFAGVSAAEEMVFKLASQGKHKNACELMAYIAHRRATVWWGYRCVCSLNEELRLKPPEDSDFEKPLEPPPIPDYFNFDVPKPDPALADMQEKVQEMLDYMNDAGDPARAIHNSFMHLTSSADAVLSGYDNERLSVNTIDSAVPLAGTNESLIAKETARLQKGNSAESTLRTFLQNEKSLIDEGALWALGMDGSVLNKLKEL